MSYLGNFFNHQKAFVTYNDRTQWQRNWKKKGMAINKYPGYPKIDSMKSGNNLHNRINVFSQTWNE